MVREAWSRGKAPGGGAGGRAPGIFNDGKSGPGSGEGERIGEMMDFLWDLLHWLSFPSLRHSIRQMPRLRYALGCTVATAVYVGVLAVITLLFYSYEWNWTVYCILLGIVLGLTAGVVVLVRIPGKVQIAGLGAITGVGLDSIITVGLGESSKSALNSLAGLIANVIAAIRETSVIGAIQQPDLDAGSETVLQAELFGTYAMTVGLWVFFIVLGLMMLFGAIADERPLAPYQE